MKNYQFEFSIQGNSEEEAEKKAKSLAAIGAKLSTDELKQLEDVVNDPVKLAVVRQKLPK